MSENATETIYFFLCNISKQEFEKLEMQLSKMDFEDLKNKFWIQRSSFIGADCGDPTHIRNI